MGIMDMFTGRKKTLPDGKYYEQDEKIRKQHVQLDMQQVRLDMQDEKIQAIAAKTKGLAQEVQRMNNERNKCVSTYTKYEPEKVQDLESNIKIRSLNKDSDYKYVTSLVFRNNEGNISDEIILAQFNNGELKTIQEKFSEQLEFQQFLALGVLNEEKMNVTFEKLREYCEDSSIDITEEGKNILTNTKNEPRNIIKTVIYMGDENTTIDANILDNNDIINYENYSIEEVEQMRETDKVVNKTVNTNNITNIDQEIDARRNEILDYINKDPVLRSQYRTIRIKINKMNLINEAYEHFSEVDDKFKSSGRENYFKLLLQNKEEKAKKYYIENKIDISNLSPKFGKEVTEDELRTKLAIKRILTYIHKEKTVGISDKEKPIYDRFLYTVETKDYYGNMYVNDEKIFLAGIIDRMKTNEVSRNEDNIQEYNNLLEREEFGEKIRYQIAPKYDGDERE